MVKYLRSTTFGCKDIGIRKLEFVGNYCSKHVLHNKFLKHIYPGTIRPISNSTKTESQALNATQGHKRS